MKLKELIKTTEVKIPDTDIVITMREDLSWIDYLETIKIKDTQERGLSVLTRMIESWNITGDDDKPIAISEDNIRKFPMKVVNELVAMANKNIKARDEKKKK